MKTKINIFAQDSLGYANALILAIGWGHNDMCLVLIAAGFDVNIKTMYGETPLMCAAGNGLEKVCSILLKNGADVNATDVFGNTPLMWAKDRNHKEICQLLREHEVKKM